MKKVILVAATVLVGGIYVSGATFASQATGTEGKVQYEAGALVIDPTDPTDPGTPQPGGNLSNRLPGNLNFGYHVIQTTKEEKWLAKDFDPAGKTVFNELAEAHALAEKTKGTLVVEDNRASSGQWYVKVKQALPFAISGDATANLGATNLAIKTGGVVNNLSLTDISAPVNGVVNITPQNLEVNVLSAKDGNGIGQTKLELTEFELTVPGNTNKKAAVYTADLNWTVSETP